MSRLTTYIKRDLPLRISLMIVLAMSLLLTITLLVMLFFSRKAMKEDALNRATVALNRAMTNIDNIMLSVEETAGNTYINMKYDNPEMMYTYARRIVEANPYVSGCAIAFKPDYFKGHQLYMAYVHHGDSLKPETAAPLISESSFGNKPYTEQAWFTKPMSTGMATWLNPLADFDSTGIQPVTSFCMPIAGRDKQPIGVISVNVSLSLLSGVMAAAKPSSNSYCALLDCDGSFIVHPVGEYLFNFSALNMPGESVHQAVETMMNGGSGYLPFNIDGRKFYLFYQPFELVDFPYRDVGDLGWSLGVVFSEEDIFGDYNRLFNYVLIIAVVGMVLLYLHIRLIIRHRLRPLSMLKERTERIAQGHYDEPIPTSPNIDEIGKLQYNFQRMQRSVAANISELNEITSSIQKHSTELQEAYQQARKADNMKTVFMHNMTNQMVAPAWAIDEDVTALCQYDEDSQKNEVGTLVEHIQHNGVAITRVLNSLINSSEEEQIQEKGGES